ncbi:broad substrate specificity ATP-binding cassette transporter ABCG2-like isoform X3 [Haliotis asinina]|uniref:broad substrate specificity ATP-binding cassette transporter ABCG2-like isoform X3 n=1 Tax=Haliotis asinina TaxID=109174 RepID=UPI003531E539
MYTSHRRNMEPENNMEKLLVKAQPNGITKYDGDAVEIDLEGGSDKQSGSVLSAHKICYEIAVKNKTCCGRSVKKKILHDVHGIFKPGMNAIMGPTGSGKTSLLDILAGRKDPQGLSGEVLIDGALPPSNFKCMVGYVVQDDVVMGTLTVRENLQFSAALRLSRSVSVKERNDRIDNVIQELGLSSCANTKVGNEFMRGVSGGERRRTNIGMELIISPPVLFLDEPTTGLDASTANAVIHMLRSLSQRGRTIIFSIHQPRYSIFKQFDRLMMLSQGQTVYHGVASQSLQFFQEMGYICEEHNNPPDFFLDVINGDVTCLLSVENKEVKEEMTVNQTLAEGFRKSKWHKELMMEVQPVYSQFKEESENGGVVRMERVEYATSFLQQFVVVAGRTLRNILRNPHAAMMQVFMMLLFAIIVGAVYFQLDTSAASGIQNRVGAFFFMVMNQIFGNLSAVEIFLRERSMFMHENVSGFYRVSSFFLAKVFCDLVPMRLVPTAVFSSVVYWLIGFKNGASHFFFFLLNLFLTTLSATSLAFAISASIQVRAVANILISLSFVFMMLFSGLLINLGSIGEWLTWAKWISIFRFSLDALCINELKDQEFCDEKVEGNITQTCVTGNSYLEQQDIAYVTGWDLWQREAALFIMSSLFLFLTYVQLRRIKKLK